MDEFSPLFLNTKVFLVSDKASSWLSKKTLYIKGFKVFDISIFIKVHFFLLLIKPNIPKYTQFFVVTWAQLNFIEGQFYPCYLHPPSHPVGLLFHTQRSETGLWQNLT